MSVAVSDAASPAQNADPSSNLIGIRVERKLGTRIDRTPPNKVFETGDILRFQLTTSMAGYLYVVDKGTTGGIATLFPDQARWRGTIELRPATHTLYPPMATDGLR